MFKIILNYLIAAIFGLLLLSNCSFFSKKNNEEIANQESNDKPKKKRYKFNTYEKAEDYAKKEGGIIFGKKEKYEFGSRNILWRASLEALSDLPVLSASYSGGLITTDWYGDAKNQMKINIVFNSSEISPNSIKISSFIRSCENGSCKISSGSDNFNSKIKNQIIEKVKNIKLSEE